MVFEIKGRLESAFENTHWNHQEQEEWFQDCIRRGGLIHGSHLIISQTGEIDNKIIHGTVSWSDEQYTLQTRRINVELLAPSITGDPKTPFEHVV
jgi:hypothetical protein